MTKWLYLFSINSNWASKLPLSLGLISITTHNTRVKWLSLGLDREPLESRASDVSFSYILTI